MGFAMKKTIVAVCAALLVQWASGVGPSIRVGTYNIRNSRSDRNTPNAWNERKDDLIDLVCKLDLDVFGLQEVRPDQAACIRARMEAYEFVGDHREADRKTGEASPVCYRKERFTSLDSGTFWLSETPDVPASKSWGTAYTRICSYVILKDKATGKRFCFANTHTDNVSALAREKGMRLIIERMRKLVADAPIVFTGDHNCRENAKPSLAVSEVLRNALYETKTPPQGPWRTFEGWSWRDTEVSAEEALACPAEVRNAVKGPSRKRFGARIDYIYVSPGIKVLDYRTVNDPRRGKKLYPSDHFPVVATIELPE